MSLEPLFSEEPVSMETNEPELLTIGAMARLSGVTVRTLRYYEEMDLIGPAKRSTGKYRLYNQRALKRIKAIGALQDLNYTLEEILVALGPYTRTQSFSKQERVTSTRGSLNLLKGCIEEKLNALTRMKAEVEERLRTLEEVCGPCVGREPEQSCQETCCHREVHLD